MIALDWGAKFIKACAVSAKGDGKYIVYASMISADGKNGEREENPLLLKNKVDTLLRQLRIKDKETSLSIGGIDLLARDFSLPKMSPENIEGAVMIEAENSIFETLDDMYSDYEILSNSDADKMDVLFIAFPKDHINHILGSFSQSELDIVGIVPDNIALANCFLAFEAKRAFSESVVLVNIGHEVSNIAIIDRGELKFIRNMYFGGLDVTREIAEIYEVDLNTAEQIKRQPELWESMGLNIRNILKKSSSNLLEAIFHSMEYAVSRQRIGKVDKILLTGGGAILTGIENFIYETLGVNTEKWNPLTSSDIIGATDKEKGFFIAVALGLALQKGESNV
ncbi:MAG: pilus assembly protein PilM [Endomicrobium sp.]|nr:pilus assembly protein PilM [Endomicrobium sp.]